MTSRTVADIAVRPAATADRDLLLAWANQPTTRAAGFHRRAISAKEHQAWLDRVLAEPSRRRIWIGRDGTRDIGVVRVELTPDGCLEVSIALDVTARGAGRSRSLLAAGLAAARSAFPGLRFRAWTRPDNEPSLALFRGAGFEVPARRPASPAEAPSDAIVLERD